MKKYICVFISILVILSLCGCTNPTEEPLNDNTSASYITTTQEQTTAYMQYEQTHVAANTADSSTTLPSTTKNNLTTQDIQKEETTIPKAELSTTNKATTSPPTTLEATIQKTGEMEFSDSTDNRYIKAINEKYGVDESLLVALYTVPENDSNIVLEFNGTKDANGKLIRNKDTLVAIYTIDKTLNSQCASEDKNRNEYPYGEMKVIYFSTTKYIMPEFEQQLNG